MSVSKFKKGDTVMHKADSRFKMVVIRNGIYGTDDRVAMSKLGNTNPNSYICKYYNEDTFNWEQKFFYEEELTLAE